MTQVEAVRRALAELGDVSAEGLASFIRANYGVTVRPQIVPVLKAMLKDEELLAEWGRKSQAAAPMTPPPGQPHGA